MEKLSKRDCRMGTNYMLKKKDLSCCLQQYFCPNSEIRYLNTLSVLHMCLQKYIIFKLFQFCYNLHSTITFALFLKLIFQLVLKDSLLSKRPTAQVGKQRSGEEGSVQVRRAGLTCYCSDRAWEKALMPHRAFHLCTSGCASYFNI